MSPPEKNRCLAAEFEGGEPISLTPPNSDVGKGRQYFETWIAGFHGHWLSLTIRGGSPKNPVYSESPVNGILDKLFWAFDLYLIILPLFYTFKVLNLNSSSNWPYIHCKNKKY